MFNNQSPSTKFQKNTNNQIPITKTRPFDLEERTYNFARKISLLVRQLPRNIINIEYAKQLARSAGSVGANYIEANESLSHKDFLLRIKICRKEAKESAYWLRLLFDNNDTIKNNHFTLLTEANELKKIFSAIIGKSK